MYHILVVDDEPTIRRTVQRILEGAGYSTDGAPNGRIGIAMHEADPADLVITDISMPEKDGLEIIRELRARWPHTKIIAMSGGLNFDSPDLLRVAKLLGASRTVAKPFHPESVLALVSKLLAARTG